ncbi:hypothetical protein LTR66_015121 [Elasticomyces elasticus]|nr:hypothetical protein LTR66_015121 [Elasticomyces elasticus]
MGSAKAGILGSVRNLFWNDRRHGTAIVRAARAARAQRDVVVCTEDGDFEFWTNNHITGNQIHRTTSVRDAVVEGMEKSIVSDRFHSSCTFKIIDFCMATTPNSTHELARRNETAATPIVLLVAISDSSTTIFYLVETIMQEDHTQVKVVHKLRLQTQETASISSFRPRICIPKDSTTAYVILLRTVVMASIARIIESPSSQLGGGQDAQPELFQDAVRFKTKQQHAIIDFANEQESAPTLVAAVQGCGVLRIVSHLPSDREIDTENVQSRMDAKTKIEQAIFFGTKQDNPLELQKSAGDAFGSEEIRAATLQIGDEIIASTSRYIPKSLSSTTEHLQLRVTALQDLSTYVLKYYPDALHKEDRFTLMFGAEKLASAQAVWKVEEAIQSGYAGKDDQQSTYLTVAINALHSSRKKDNDEARGEVDAVRHWFQHSVANIDKLLLEIEDCVHEIEAVVGSDPTVAGDYLTEAVDLLTQAWDAAFRFREDNANVYGLGNEIYQDGVLKEGYPEGITQIWTSSKELIDFTYRFIMQECKYLSEWSGYQPAQTNGTIRQLSKKSKSLPTKPDGEEHAPPESELLDELKARLSRQVELFTQDREDTDLLVELSSKYMLDLQAQAHSDADSRADCEQKIRNMQATTESYYSRFGMKWATSSFTSMIENSELSRLLAKGQAQDGKKQALVTEFLKQESKTQPDLGRISWINDVLGEDSYKSASETLGTVVAAEEEDLWSRKTETCLAKLAGLATLESEDSTTSTAHRKMFDSDLQYIRIQESLAHHIEYATIGLIDEDAMVGGAMNAFLPDHYKKHEETATKLEFILAKLINSQVLSLAELVDALTHFQLQPFDEEDETNQIDDLSTREFTFALKAIEICPSRDASPAIKRGLRNSIWRRLLTLDKWIKLNKSDTQVKHDMTNSHLYITMRTILADAESTGSSIGIPQIDDLINIDESQASHKVKAEVKILRGFVEKARLRDHFEGLITEAKKAVADHLSREKHAKTAASSHQATEEPYMNGNVKKQAQPAQVNGNHA